MSIQPQKTSQRGEAGAQPGSALVRLVSHPACISVLLAAITWAVFHPVRSYDYVNLDDPKYVTANSHVQGGLTRESVLWAFRSTHAGFWHPLTWLSHMLDVQCFGLGAAGPHLVNLSFHLANTVLLFLVLKRMTGAVWRPALAAALFGWHPLRVESVAWIAERKDVLSGFFFMLALWAYGEYVRGVKDQVSGGAQPVSGVTHHPSLYYGLTLVLFALGLMSKPMLVTFPFVLLLADFWPLGRLQVKAGSRTETVFGLLREKVPFFLMTIASCIITFLGHKQIGAVQALSNYPLGVRVENALVSYVRYLGKTLWPVGLATPYPDPVLWPPVLFGTAALLLVAMTLGALWLRRRFPFVVTGWFWFCGALVPVIGIVQAGAQAMADRFTYLPLIGVFIGVVWGAAAAFTRWRVPVAVSGTIAGLILLFCAVRTRDQLRHWQNSESLLSHATAVTRNNWLAHHNLGWELERQGRLDEALHHYRQAVAIARADTDSLIALGNLLAKQGQYAEALPNFETALRTKPDAILLHYNIARALLRLERFDEAIPHYEALLQRKPDHLASRLELGIALALKGSLEQAADCFREVLRHRPDDADAHFNLGETLILQNKPAEAIPHLTEALRLRPTLTEARRELRVLGVAVP